MTTEQKVLPYVELKHPNGFTEKLINFDHPEMCPRKGKIQLIAIKNRNNNQPSVVLPRSFKDPATGIRYGIPSGIDDKGKMIFQRIELRDFRIYDLTEEEDAREWAVVRMAHFILGSPLQSGKPLYKVIDEEVEALGKIELVKTAQKAMEIALSLKGIQLIDFARNIGITPEKNSPVVTSSLVFEYARTQPDKFMLQWDNDNRLYLTSLKRAIATSVVKYQPLTGYVHKNGILIGENEAVAISFLKKNNAMFVSIENESKKLDTFYKKEEEGDFVPLKAIKPNNDISDREKELENEMKMKDHLLKEQEARLAKLEAMMMDRPSLNVLVNEHVSVPNFFAPEEPVNKVEAPVAQSGSDLSFEGMTGDQLMQQEKSIREEAKFLGIRNWHVVKLENLITQIKEKREEQFK